MKIELEKLPEDIYKKLAEELYDGVYFVNNKRKIIFTFEYITYLTHSRFALIAPLTS